MFKYFKLSLKTHMPNFYPRSIHTNKQWEDFIFYAFEYENLSLNTFKYVAHQLYEVHNQQLKIKQEHLTLTILNIKEDRERIII